MNDTNKISEYLNTIVSKQLDVNVLDVKYIGGGSYGFVYKVEVDKEPNTLVVKAFKINGMHKKEAYQLGVLQAYSTVKIPQVYFTYDSTDECPIDCMGMEFIDGKDAFTNSKLLFKSPKAKREFADKLTDGLHSIHNCTGDKFGDVQNPVYDSWQDYYRPYVEDILQKAEELYNEGKLEGNV